MRLAYCPILRKMDNTRCYWVSGHGSEKYLIRRRNVETMEKQFSLQRPCSQCPFRIDGDAVNLSPGRKEQIIEKLLSGEHATFHCHKTVYRSDGRNHDEDGNFIPVDVAHCPGAAAICRKFGRDTTVVQIASRWGYISNEHYDLALNDTLDAEHLKINRRKARI